MQRSGSVKGRPDVAYDATDTVRVKPARSYRAYFPAVDGLRGAAISSVLLYHTNMFSNGLFGVDIFFVLSGFFITLLFMREMDNTGRISIGGFYRRRFKRLIPGLMISLGLVVVLAYLFGTLAEARAISLQAVAALFQVANWAQLAQSRGYWDHFGAINPLAHMWSLSITEQFYLVWPLVMALLCWIFRRSMLTVTVVVFVVFGACAVAAPMMYNGNNSDRLYLGTESRAVAFLAGAAAACVVHLVLVRRSGGGTASTRDGSGDSGGSSPVLVTLVSAAALIGLVTMSVLTSSYHESWLYRGGLAAVASVAALLTATLCTNAGPLVRVFSWSPLVEIGKLSYTMYLLHLPVYWVLQHYQPLITPYALLLLGGGLTWLFSFLLHYGVTERIRARPWQVSSAVAALCLASVGITLGAYYLPVAVEQQMHVDGKPTVLALGDSVASDFATALAHHGSRQFTVVDGGVAGCGVMSSQQVRDRTGLVVPISDSCRQWENSWKITIRKYSPQVILVHLGWDATQQYVDGGWLSPCDPAYRRRYTAQLEKAEQVWIGEAPNVPVLLSNERSVTGATDAAAGRCYDAIIEAFASSQPHVKLLDVQKFFCSSGPKCRDQTEEGEPIFRDGVHYTPKGMDYLAPWLENQLTAR